ncbi:MAG: alanine racemase [Lachnospiraceae bacterium]|uniref:Alanine racemase n=1 Tax=Candidatus Weimeria bifida TaxID=2599074 RepID=A0A6N7IWW1_9FIRM|nr:alanine racemase [Candidatus Weimeria bifida]RRF95673.1 MAG: alanine racemase [Lachnospiraceae bacterium]
MDFYRICAKVDLNAIEENIHAVKLRCPDQKIYAVMKADGYGFGAVPIAKDLEKDDEIYGYAAATAEEAYELLEAGIKKPILILGFTFTHSYERIIREGVRPVIFTKKMADDYASYARQLGKKVFCHIGVDTGMSRIGYQVNEGSADEIAAIFKEHSELVPEGIFTHFARADEGADTSHTDEQYAKFMHMIDMLKVRGVNFKIRHCCNSAASMEYTKDKLDAVRLGVTMYGMWPSDDVDHSFPIHRAVSLVSHIVHLKTISAGTEVSYGGTYVAKAPTKIATVPVGYADGYPRSLSGKADVIIHGKRCPIVGRICMDQMMVDVSDVPDVAPMDEVTLIGKDGDEEITVEELGDLSGRFNYELACDLGIRIPRLYYRNGEMVEKKKFYK